MNDLRLLARYLDISVRSQLEYRASFVMLSVGYLLITVIEFLSVWVLFDRFGNLQGWSLPEIAFFYGIINIAFALGESAARGFDLFSPVIKSGDFDRLLLRPRSTALQVAGQELTLRRVGRLLQGACVLGWSASALGLQWSTGQWLLLGWTLLGGTCLFYGLMVIQGTVCFWTTESLEFMNAFTNGGVFAAQYPFSIYRDWFRRFFTFGVPLACVSYYPALALQGRPDPLGTPALLHWLAPLVGLLFLALCLQAWHWGVRHYRSSGS
ncbi:MAG: ABC-2 family transporter protein [Candidatus Handelsmanbacteria bacterium]|nr:ABC-2 family transporter protein [Candidatus Handelsmanbacteria bacterium]